MTKFEEKQSEAAQGNNSALETSWDRREVVATGAGLAVALTVGLGAASDAEAAKKRSPDKMKPQVGDRLQVIKGKRKGEVLRADALEVGARPIEAFPYDASSDVLRDGSLAQMAVVAVDDGLAVSCMGETDSEAGDPEKVRSSLPMRLLERITERLEGSLTIAEFGSNGNIKIACTVPAIRAATANGAAKASA